MKSSDETKIIKTFQSRFRKKPRFQPEDVEVLKIKNAKFVVKSDMLVQSTDVPAEMKLGEIARKSLVSCVSDFACKGIKPIFATIALAIPRGFTQKMINELADGFLKSSKEFGLRIVGGDTNEGKELVIEVSMFGDSSKKMPTRGGAKAGDIVITSGPFGYSSAGLKIVLNGYKVKSQAAKEFRKAIFRPTPRLAFGLRAARYFSSSMDSSDGLAITLNDMSEQSKKKFVITSIPTKNNVIKFARQNKINLEDLVFCGGEEYEIVFTIHPRDLNRVRNLAKKIGISLYEIGYATNGKNVVLVDNDRFRVIKRCGWTHLRS
ncbi:MAG: thiamine-phosphate kinase [Thaumarchaeota archaeon]|nr:thiamine-phosphate kinase [Nitrososphaerota archaeon]MDE1838416.1 thiamine-phosphate kinase [Nitrososphaerota archaeon]